MGGDQGEQRRKIREEKIRGRGGIDGIWSVKKMARKLGGTGEGKLAAAFLGLMGWKEEDNILGLFGLKVVRNLWTGEKAGEWGLTGKLLYLARGRKRLERKVDSLRVQEMEEGKGEREMAVVGMYDVRIARNLIGKTVGDWGLTWKPRWLTGRSMKPLKEAGFLMRDYIPAYFSSLT
jgi:hypothetical protein